MSDAMSPELVPARRLLIWPWVFVAWNVVVWAGRVRLGKGQEATVLVALTFLIPTIVLAVALVWFKRAVPAAAGALALWTFLYWPVKLVNIALHNHPVPFVVVHVVLGVVSVAVAGMGLRSALQVRSGVSVTPA